CNLCSCCPINLLFYWLGKELPNGEQFPDPTEPCRVCICWEGSVSCQPRACPLLQCPFPARGPCCQVCEGGLSVGCGRRPGWASPGGSWAPPAGVPGLGGGSVPGECLGLLPPSCEYLGKGYLDGQEFPDPQDGCSHCTCLHGFVTCTKTSCDPPGCRHPTSPPGQCCPVCQGEPRAGKGPVLGCALLESPAMLPSAFTLSGGKPAPRWAGQTWCPCLRRASPATLSGPSTESHPLPPDSDGSCSYQGQRYQASEHWQVDTCTTCTCVSGEVHCRSQRCPPAASACDQHLAGLCALHCGVLPISPLAQVLWSGHSQLEVSVPGTYKGHMCGLCGDFNGHPQDDARLRSGQLARAEAAFGNSWRVSGGQRPPVPHQGIGVSTEANARCKVLKSGTFEPCHPLVPPEPFFAACVYDLCACGAGADQCLCDVLEAYTALCRRAGLALRWPVGCPQDRGYVFDECGPPCPKTCYNKDAPLGAIESHCFTPCMPGCQCPAGRVEHEAHCILPEACPRVVYGSL
uniref:Kielin cysteine rich BMP regulator n=1 Tax=Gopherus evgoodei TaxID=1825980 RepID=A0A8C4W873_9SAUR